MFENRINDLVLTSLVVDSYCLGMHWIYDEEQLSKKDIDWENLSQLHKAVWHQGKKCGVYSLWRSNFWFIWVLKIKNSFDENVFKILV